jgi:hypothetical protein
VMDRSEWMLDGAVLVPLSAVIDHDDDSWGGSLEGAAKRLLCPVCRYECQHAATTWQNVPGHDAYRAGWGGRGDLLIIPMWGECEHSWELCFGSHKGQTFCFVRWGEKLTKGCWRREAA